MHLYFYGITSLSPCYGVPTICEETNNNKSSTKLVPAMRLGAKMITASPSTKAIVIVRQATVRKRDRLADEEESDSQSVSAQKECDNQALSLVYALPPTFLERQSTLDHLRRSASIPLTLSPRLTGWYRQKGIMTKQPDDIAVSAVFEDHRETTRRSSVMDRYRAIVLKWPPLVVQINQASVRTKDGDIIAPPLLPLLTTTRAGSTGSSTTFFAAVMKAAPDALLFGSIDHTGASTNIIVPYETSPPWFSLTVVGADWMECKLLARTLGRSTGRWPT
jgi:hypothetical protein